MMGFAADWLALREPYDARARHPGILQAVAAAMAERPSVAVVDLACGTGATLRALAPHLPERQSWRLVDNDLSLLARAAPALPAAGKSVTTIPIDLAHDLEAALDGFLDLVTATALLDLVSADWLERLAVEAAARRLPVYAALNYDGRVAFEPVDRFDTAVVTAVHRRQESDGGFGPALGPAAANTAVVRLEAVGYRVLQGRSDWTLGPRDGAIQAECLTGWAAAAQATGELPLREVIGWLERRRDHITAGRSSIRVGHLDLFGQPTTTR